jgi:hypothetical protein
VEDRGKRVLLAELDGCCDGLKEKLAGDRVEEVKLRFRVQLGSGGGGGEVAADVDDVDHADDFAVAGVDDRSGENLVIAECLNSLELRRDGYFESIFDVEPCVDDNNLQG